MTSILMRRAGRIVAAGVVAAMALSTGQAVATTHPVAPRLIDLAAPAGSSAAVARPSGTLPTYFLSPTRQRTKQSVRLHATKAGSAVDLAVPLATAPDSYYVLACHGTTCAPATKQLSVSPRLTHLLPRLKVAAKLGGAPVSKALTAAKGGSLSVKVGPATYTLAIPPRTLLDDTTVSLQPITTVSGITSVSGAGVRIEPNGLDLAGAGTLTVSGAPAPGKGDEVSGFTTPDSGSGVALVPAQRKGGAYVEPVYHFSDHGMFAGPDVRLDAIASHAAASAKDQFFEQAADAIRHGDFGAAQDIVASGVDDYYGTVVRPLLEDALDRDSSASAILAVRDALEYLHDAQLIGADGDRSLADLGIDKQMFAYLLQLLYRNSYNDCARGDYIKGVQGMLGAVRQAQLLGQDDVFDYANLGGDIDKCLHFRLDFDSDVSETDSDGSTDLHVVAPIDVKGAFNAGDGSVSYAGTGPLTYDTATDHHHSTQDSCGGIEDTTEITGSTGSTMSVNSMDFDPAHATATDPRLSVKLDPGEPTENYHEYGTECPDGSAFDITTAVPGWLFYWGSVLHYTEATTSSGDGESGPPWTFSTFTPGSGDLVGTQAIHQETDIQLGDSDDVGHLSEHTEIKLTHTPGPPPALPKKPKLPPVK